MRISFFVVLALAGAGLSACGGGDKSGPSAEPGLLTVTLTNAASAPGAIMFTVSGGTIDAVTASGYTTYQTSLSATSRRVLLTGNITAGDLLQIQVPDVNKASSYVATVQQVSARSTAPAPYSQQATNGFVITVSR